MLEFISPFSLFFICLLLKLLFTIFLGRLFLLMNSGVQNVLKLIIVCWDPCMLMHAVIWLQNKFCSLL